MALPSAASRPLRPPRLLAGAALVLGLGCRPAPAPGWWTAGAPEAAPPAEAFAAFDPDGDGIDTIVRLHAGTLSRDDGGPSLVVAGDWQRSLRRAGGGLVVAMGAGRSDRSAPVVLHELGPAGAEERLRATGPRTQLTSLAEVDGRLFLARFIDSRRVQGAWLEDGAERAVSTVEMGLQQVPWGADGLVVGRLYGDAPRSPGDLRLQTLGGPAEGARDLPAHRGVRHLARLSIAGWEGGADGPAEDVLAVCDGWHYAYGEHGDPRLMLHWGPSLARATIAAWLDGSYACEQVLALPDSPRPALVVRASHGIHLVQRGPGGWEQTRIAAATERDQIALAHGEDGPVLLVAGPTSQRIPLRLESAR